jgi:hypothetical protein
MDIQPFGWIAKAQKDIPQTQAILATRHSNQHSFTRPEHVELFNGPLYLLRDPFQEMVLA